MKTVNIVLPISFYICFGCLKEGSFEHPQHMLWLRNKKNLVTLYLTKGLVDLFYMSEMQNFQNPEMLIKGKYPPK